MIHAERKEGRKVLSVVRLGVYHLGSEKIQPKDGSPQKTDDDDDDDDDFIPFPSSPFPFSRAELCRLRNASLILGIQYR